MITSYHRTGAAPWYDYLFDFTGGDVLRWVYQDPSQNVSIIQSAGPPASPFQTGVWYHCAFARDAAGAAALWFEGNRVAFEATEFQNINFEKHDSGRIAIGRYYAPSTTSGGVRFRPLDGWITNCRVLNGEAAYDPNDTTITIPTGYFTP